MTLEVDPKILTHMGATKKSKERRLYIFDILTNENPLIPANELVSLIMEKYQIKESQAYKDIKRVTQALAEIQQPELIARQNVAIEFIKIKISKISSDNDLTKIQKERLTIKYLQMLFRIEGIDSLKIKHEGRIPIEIIVDENGVGAEGESWI